MLYGLSSKCFVRRGMMTLIRLKAFSITKILLLNFTLETKSPVLQSHACTYTNTICEVDISSTVNKEFNCVSMPSFNCCTQEGSLMICMKETCYLLVASVARLVHKLIFTLASSECTICVPEVSILIQYYLKSNPEKGCVFKYLSFSTMHPC